MIRKILLVSNSDLAEAMWDVLLLRNFEVLTAHSGLEALRILSPSEHVNLIIADDCLEDMDGLVFMNLLKARSIPTPVILMVNTDEVTDEVYRQFGLAGILRKPAFDVFSMIDEMNGMMVN